MSHVPSLFTSMEHWAKRVFVGFQKCDILASLQARMSRDRFLLFLHHNYHVSLNSSETCFTMGKAMLERYPFTLLMFLRHPMTYL